jgi:ATP-binding cassette subfamily B protein/ATP-binding cassette subfamily C protein
MVSQYDQRRTGDLLSRVGADTTLLRAVVTPGLFETVTGAIMMVGAAIGMILIDAVLFAITAVGMAAGLGVAIVFTRRVRPGAGRKLRHVVCRAVCARLIGFPEAG